MSEPCGTIAMPPVQWISEDLYRQVIAEGGRLVRPWRVTGHRRGWVQLATSHPLEDLLSS